MAISIPIISTFSAKGIKQAKAEFAKLETVGQKTGFILGKAAMGATAAFAGLAAGAVAVGGFLFKAAKAADADRKSQIDLAKTAERFAKANKAQVAGLEATVEQLMLATGIADDDLRPSLGRLIRSFKNTDKASRAMKIALDISGRTGKDLESVVEAMGKAADGSNTALLRLGTGLSKADLKGKSLDEVMALLETRFKGGAKDAANTFEGRMERLRVRFGELVEDIGYKVLPYLEKFADMLIDVADAFGEQGIAGAWEELKRQFAQAGFEQSPVGQFFRNMYDTVRTVYNALVDLFNLAATVSGARFLSNISGAFGGPELFRPSKMPEYSGFMNVNMPSSAAQFRERETGRVPQSVIINVNGGDPAATVDALRRYSRQNGGISGVRLS
jgi:hypothetical protein